MKNKKGYYKEFLHNKNEIFSELCENILDELRTFPNKSALSKAIYKDVNSYHVIVARVLKYLEEGKGENAVSAALSMIRKIDALPLETVKSLKNSVPAKKGRKPKVSKEGIKK